LFGDIGISGQQDPDVRPRPQCAGEGGGNGGQSADPNEVVHLRRDKENSQGNPPSGPSLLPCKKGSSQPGDKFKARRAVPKKLPCSPAALEGLTPCQKRHREETE
jgi:hypothetical protein